MQIHRPSIFTLALAVTSLLARTHAAPTVESVVEGHAPEGMVVVNSTAAVGYEKCRRGELYCHAEIMSMGVLPLLSYDHLLPFPTSNPLFLWPLFLALELVNKDETRDPSNTYTRLRPLPTHPPILPRHIGKRLRVLR